MNIFIFDYNMTKNAQYHTDKHLVKMIVEHVQILSSAYYFIGNVPTFAYKLTHANHPACVWARASVNNWLWLKDMTSALCQEFEFRYKKPHRSCELLKSLPTPNLPQIARTKFAIVVPKQYRLSSAPKSYRTYLVKEKAHLLKWSGRKVPRWVTNMLLESTAQEQNAINK